MLRTRDDFYNAADYDLEIESRFLARQPLPEEDFMSEDALMWELNQERLFDAIFSL